MKVKGCIYNNKGQSCGLISISRIEECVLRPKYMLTIVKPSNNLTIVRLRKRVNGEYYFTIRENNETILFTLHSTDLEMLLMLMLDNDFNLAKLYS